MRHSRFEHPRFGLAIAGTAVALTAAILPVGSATAQSPSTLCETAGHGATTREILSRSRTNLTRVESEIAGLQVEFHRASATSPSTSSTHTRTPCPPSRFWMRN